MRSICCLTLGISGREGQPHGDKLSFLLHAYGRRLIDAPGIVGAGKGVGIEESVYAPDPDSRWMSTPSFDFAEGWYKGSYGDDDAVRDLVHKRSIFYVRGEYFILHDLVLGEGSTGLSRIFTWRRDVRSAWRAGLCGRLIRIRGTS